MVVVVGDTSGPVGSHLVRALAEHERWCRTNAVEVPVELRDLLLALSANRGQARTSAPSPAGAGDGERMLLALDYDACAARLGVSERTVRRLVANGQLPAVSIGGCRRVRAVDLVAYIEGLED